MKPVATRNEAHRLLDFGYSVSYVARRVGIHRSTLECWLKDDTRKRRLELKQIRKGNLPMCVPSPEPEVEPEETRTIPVDRLREAVQRACMFGLSRGEICRRIGWKSDSSNLARKLGELETCEGNLKTEIEEPLALRILEAIHLDPVDIGI